MLSMDNEQILDEVEIKLRNFWYVNSNPDELSPEIRELYWALVNPNVEPIKLSLFIEGHKDSDNPEDDFSVHNKQLLEFLREDPHVFIKERIEVQLAKYYCIKHIEKSRLFLCYLELITDPEHRAMRENYKELRHYHILDKLIELVAYSKENRCTEYNAFMCSIAIRITKEYMSDFYVYIY